MKSRGFWRRLLRFLRNVLIMLLINLGVGYLIVRMTNSYTMESQGRIMIILGCLYMLVGIGSLTGRMKYRNNMTNVYAQSLSGRSMREFAADDVSRFDKNFSFTLHGAFVGSITLIIGLMMYGH